jgi:hypothetical protein
MLGETESAEVKGAIGEVGIHQGLVTFPIVYSIVGFG